MGGQQSTGCTVARVSPAVSICFVAALATVWAGAAVAGCNKDGAAACQISTGEYHITLPENANRPVPVVMFLHGYGGSGLGALRNTAMVNGLQERGYAVIAPNATERRNGNRSWVFFPGWEGRDEAAFLQDVMADAGDRFGVSQENTVLSGFSAGGFMVNYLACEHPDHFAAYASVSGGFWRPQPTECAGPIRLHHTHGWRDKTVPVEGRQLGGGRFEQGDIHAGLELWRQVNGCASHAPDRVWEEGDDLRRRWDCGEGADIEFTLFPGGHRVPKGWAAKMLNWYEAGS